MSPVPTDSPTMSLGHAALITLITEYVPFALDASRDEAQYLMYFLHVLGEPLELQYTLNRNGPVSAGVDVLFSEVTEHFATNCPATAYASWTGVPVDVERQAHEVVAHHPGSRLRVARVSEVIDGFESAYALQLLATVQWMVRHVPEAANDLAITVRAIGEWTTHDPRMYTEEHIRIAWSALRDRTTTTYRPR